MKSSDFGWHKYGVFAVLLAVMFYPVFIWMWQRWNAPETYYSHGLLIPIASAVFIWWRKDDLAKLEKAAHPAGIPLLVLGLIMHAAGMLIKFYFLSACALIVLLAGGILVLLGGRALKILLFPLLYLGFMIPAPLVLISNLVIKMKLFAAHVATGVLNKIGLEATRDGSLIRMAHAVLEVEAPCSGLRSLISLLAFGAAFAYVTRHNAVKKWILFISALPIALAANVSRIVLLGWVSEVYGQKTADGWIHDFSGFLLFAVAAVLLLAVNSLLGQEAPLSAGHNE